MNGLLDVLAAVLVACGAFFFLAGTVGLLRFPDVLTRLHALTKADTLGLGFVVMALMIRTESWAIRLKLLLIWVLVLVATATTCHLIARTQTSGAGAGSNRHGPETGPQ
jgi:multicomponent Na+:H+ antiporter subunit G